MKALGIDDERLTDFWFDQFKLKYSERWRHYHTMVHVHELLKLCNEFQSKVNEMDVIKLAVWFHDVIYISESKNNEENSAKYFRQFVMTLNDSGFSLDSKKTEKVCKIIMYTANHMQESKEIDAWSDAQFFLDIDLSILGSPWDTYLEYTKKIREEYIFVGNEFSSKRAEFMEKFLSKHQNLYRTDFFREKYQNQAIANIKKEIDLLRNASS